jgi:hypothetical protein
MPDQLPPDPDATEKWKQLAQNQPSNRALPPATGGTRLFWWLLVLLVVFLLLGLIFESGLLN